MSVDITKVRGRRHLRDLLARYRMIRSQQSALEMDADDIMAELEAILSHHNIDRLRVYPYVLSIHTVSESEYAGSACLRAIEMSSQEHGKGAARIATEVSSRSIQAALRFLASRIASSEIESLTRLLDTFKYVRKKRRFRISKDGVSF